VTWAAEYLKSRYNKPGNVYVGLVHRLDRPTSGVVLMAKTSKAAGRLAGQFREGGVRKVYLAVVEGSPPTLEGRWCDVLEKDPADNRVRRVDRPQGGGRERDAEVAYRVLEHARDWSMLELRPATGRSHQLRVQLAGRGLPIVGDRKYGASSVLEAEDGGRRIALHARSLGFTHPTRGVEMVIEAPLPADWPAPMGR
jgi:23S rRNA pseudouridine1911/1915/1917 synthase